MPPAATGPPEGPPPPTFADVLDARRRIAPYLSPTAQLEHPALSDLVGAETLVKHENHQPTGAFKIRGGINLVSRLGEPERGRGVAAASTGNHGASVAYAARLFGVPATIHVPAGANPVKVAAMRRLGARVVAQGPDFDAARERCEREAAEAGLRYVHSGDEPLLIAGVATAALELLEAVPRLDVLLVTVGGGSGAAAACLVAAAVRPELEVIGVQSEEAPAAERSWRARALRTARNATFAEGLATGSAFALPQRMMWERLDDLVLVSDEELRVATLAMLAHTRNLVEAAGAAPLAGALRLRERLRGRRVGLIASGANVGLDALVELLTPERRAALTAQG